MVHAWRPTRRIWITCSSCGKYGHPAEAVTAIDPGTGERRWTCSDCGLPPDARARAVRRRLNLEPGNRPA